MKRIYFSIFLVSSALVFHGCSSSESESDSVEEMLEANEDSGQEIFQESSVKPTLEFKGSKVSYFGSNHVTSDQLLEETKLIDIADRRFESKWLAKDPKGISEEYTPENAVFMKPGTKPRNGRAEIEQEFAKSVQGTDKVSFFQDELQFFGNMDVAFQRCHMQGYVNTEEEHVFEGSYVILWKKVDGAWLIEYDMFNADK